MVRQEGNEDAEKQILGIIKRERERSFWRRLKYSMDSWTGGGVHSVQVKDAEGNVKVLSTQQEVHDAIWSNIHWKRLFLAEEAPICKGTLREVFGYNADTEAGEEVLDGTFWYNPDFDQLTKDLCEELAKIGTVIPKIPSATSFGTDSGESSGAERERKLPLLNQACISVTIKLVFNPN